MPGTSSASRKGATRPRTQADNLVQPPRAVPQQAAIEGSIFEPVANPLSRRELHRRLDAVIRAWLVATCRWKKESTVGEFRYGAMRSFFFLVRMRKSLYLRRPASTSDRM